LAGANEKMDICVRVKEQCKTDKPKFAFIIGSKDISKNLKKQTK
jgi:hypothetical protein